MSPMNNELFGEIQQFYDKYFEDSYKKFVKKMEKNKIKLTKYEKRYIKDLIIYLNKVVFNDLLEQEWNNESSEDTSDDSESSESDDVETSECDNIKLVKKIQSKTYKKTKQ